MLKLKKKFNQNVNYCKALFFNKKTKHLYTTIYSKKKGRPYMEIKKLSDLNQVILMIGFIIIGIFGRYILVNFGAPPNFEIIMVLTFLAIIFIKPSIAIFVPLFSMIFSDILLGNSIFLGSQMNRIVLFTYSGFTIIALINVFNRDRFKKSLENFRLKNIGISAGLGIGFVLIYDIWTNIGWWYLIYPHNASALAAVFTAGIPFMINHLISGVITFVCVALPIIVYVSKKTNLVLPIKIKNFHKIPVSILVICLIALSFTGTATQVPEKSEIWLEKTDATSVKIKVLGNGWILEDNIVAYDEETVFYILKEFSNRNNIAFDYTFYEQFDSVLIDSINGDINGVDGKYWQYYVNEDIPMIGADKYRVTNGDYIEWRFEIISI